ncbi:glycosyltransferase family 4 protein [Streptomyces heilongjiangensis]|uniref:D-inositol 3-phosphate glycosyltransferase n=1 Tax=Streptomyces heilongjiangensis TaxID=945052 RepID=A0ABW1B0V4_9ACTN|nr:glycosyltransferase family 4 protein [Streptomyces heilongjiangensis]MDC2946491.1 glycosyltransferase family 4 protein [Streptomyces heilongjiangensis]
MATAAFAPTRATPGPGRPATVGAPDRDPLVAARTAFFSGARWTARHAENRPTGHGRAEDRTAGGRPVDGHLAGGRPAEGPAQELARLLEAEYGLRPRAVPPGDGLGVGREDAAVAGLRRAARLGVPLTPEALLAHQGGDPWLRAVLTELWPETVRWHGHRHAEEALRAVLTEAPDAPATGHLLDLAVATGLAPLTPAETATMARHTDRAARHSAWRYLHQLPGGPAHLPGPAEAADAYEALLLDPPAPVLGPRDGGRDGRLVAQTMLLGGLDTPGQGLSGGMSVLLGGLGDRLAETDGIAGVITVVTAGHEDLAADGRLAHERRTGHWVLRLPLDTPGSPAPTQTHRHRSALTWWAVRLLGGLPRPLDVLHVRYADDGSLALADAAERLGAATVFTATPDPHRGLAERHAASVGGDPAAARALRHDLHRVFLADRLVERADTVVGIPGRGGTRELVRHFPDLARLAGGEGPSAPPEGIAPYRPAPDEDDRRRAALAALYCGGDRPDALDPEDDGLPLLLCVGRLHPVKQQDLLVRAWLASGGHRTSTLVLVGGSPHAGTEAETDMRRRIDTLLADRPQAARRLALLPALPNADVRRLQRALAGRPGSAPCWYVCPSAKEEFGIAILEAMEAGLPVAGPQRGGVAHYLHDGANGILLDTSGQAGLVRGLLRLAAVPDDDRRRYAQAGRDLVAERFSVTRMADELAAEYRALHRH